MVSGDGDWPSPLPPETETHTHILPQLVCFLVQDRRRYEVAGCDAGWTLLPWGVWKAGPSDGKALPLSMGLGRGVCSLHSPRLYQEHRTRAHRAKGKAPALQSSEAKTTQ